MADITKPVVGEFMWGSDANNTFDQLNALKADQSGLDELKALVMSLQEAVYGLIVPQDIIYRYDADSGTTEGSTLAPGNDILEVNGVVTYSSAAAAHGTYGLHRAVGVNGNWLYPNLSVAQSSGSVYMRVTDPLVSSQGNLIQFETSTDSTIQGVSLVIKTGGAIQLIAPDGTPGPSTEGEWTQDKWFRVDWQQTYDGSHQTITFRIFLSDSEGTDYTGNELAAVYDVNGMPDRIRFLHGNDSSSWGIDVDTYRTKNSIAWYNPFNPQDPGYEQTVFDTGNPGSTIPVGVEKIVATSGSPTYVTTSGLDPAHGTVGMLVPASTGGGTVAFTRLDNGFETGSVYFHYHIAGSATKVIVWENSSGNRLFAINIGSAKKLFITDGAGNSKVSSGVNIPVDSWVRIDWQTTWVSGGDTTVTFKLFLIPESVGGPDGGAVTYTFTGAEAITDTPSIVQFGATGSDWQYQLDTIRLWNNTDFWPTPFGTPVQPPLWDGEAGWAGDARQSTVELTYYSASRYATTGMKVSANADMSSPLATFSEVAPTYGFNKWHVTSLPNTGTKYYYQAQAGGVAVGPIRSFNTLKATGTPCVTKIAVFACKQDNPANSAVATNIMSWGPDRVMDLGDFGYPGNLSPDEFTHAYNWGLNVTDPAVQIYQDHICHDYVISDHDVNGGVLKSGNAPNYHDDTSQANMDLWVKVVPAVVVDTRVPARGRYRSYVEGPVRYILVDTRTWDRTDTVTVPSDPYSTTATMLGSTQFDWVKSEIDAAAAAGQMVIMFTDPAWNGVTPVDPDGYIEATYSDKWPTYIYERTQLSNYAASKLAKTSGSPNMIIIHSDSHLHQLDDGTTPGTPHLGMGGIGSDINGIVVACTGPFHQNVHAHYQDSYNTINYPAGVVDGGGPYRSAMQYLRLTVDSVTTPGSVIVTMDHWDCTPFKSNGNPPYASGTPKSLSTISGSGVTTPFVKTYVL